MAGQTRGPEKAPVNSAAILCEDATDAGVLWYRLKMLGWGRGSQRLFLRDCAIAAEGAAADFILILCEILGLAGVRAIDRPSFGNAKTRVLNQELFNAKTWCKDPWGNDWSVDHLRMRRRAAS